MASAIVIGGYKKHLSGTHMSLLIRLERLPWKGGLPMQRDTTSASKRCQGSIPILCEPRQSTRKVAGAANFLDIALALKLRRVTGNHLGTGPHLKSSRWHVQIGGRVCDTPDSGIG